ncbi:MAG: hypothetical protein K1X78_28550 [Verrucomicrobiaceae bacterium]|nr:hypothetical protein [Verrucomicrobiaceae bacterium]
MNLELKLRISILWMANTVIDLVQIVLSLFGTGFIEQLQKGRIGDMVISGAQIAAFTFSLVVPVVMAFLVFVIPNPKTNKWMNVVPGIVIAGMSWLDFLMRAPHLNPAFLVSAFATNIAPTVVVFLAWRLDRTAN